MQATLFFIVVLSLSQTQLASCFSLLPSANGKNQLLRHPLAAEPYNEGGGQGIGREERIEFKIYPDGRVEEKVTGIKGGDCHKVTEKINEMLGEVVESTPTEEAFEQEMEVEEVLYNRESASGADWDSGSTW